MVWFFVIVVVIGVVAFIQIQKARHNVDKILCVQASKRNGRVYKQDDQFYPMMSFLHRGIMVYVYTFPKMRQSKVAVRVHIDILTYRKCQIGIYRNSSFSKAILKDCKRIRLDNEKFNERFIVRTDDDFFADNAVRSKHFRDNLEIFIARSIDEVFDTSICEVLKQKLFPEQVVPQTQEQLDELLAETNSSYTDAVNECVRVFRNGLTDDSDEVLEILESKLLSAREMLDKNVGAIEHELTRRKTSK